MRTIAVPTAISILVPIDCTIRETISHSKFGENGARIEETKDTTRPARNIFLRPIKSLTFPITGWAIALVI